MREAPPHPADWHDAYTRAVLEHSADAHRAESERGRQWQSMAMLTAMDGMAILDERGRYLSVNRAHAAIYGYDAPEELHGRSWTSLYPDIELRRLLVEVVPVLMRYGSWRGEATGRRRDSTTFPQELSLSHLPEGGIVCVVRDITESRRAEQELRASEQRFRTVVEALAEAIVITGLDERVVYCNSRLAEMTGVPVGEMLGRDLAGLCAPEDRARLGEMRELRLSRADGEVVWAEVNGSPFRNPEGRIVGTVAVLTDVTERRRAAEERERLLSLLNATLESTADALVATDAAGLVTHFNRHFAEMWGIPDHRLARREADELVRAALHQLADPAAFLARMEELAARPEEESFDLLALKDGRAIERYSRPLRMDGAVAGRVWSFRDVTERTLEEREIRAARDAAEAANRAKSEFLSSMSHELRTPLNSVIGFAGVLMKNRGGGLGEQELRYLDRIRANGTHLLGLINDVLDLSKIEAGKMEVERSPLSLGELVSETLAELDGAGRGTPVELRAELPEGPALVVSDRVKLKQVLINLVGNALKFTERGTVTVALVEDRATGRPARLEVRDTGVGIPPDRLAAIFGAFEQAESGISRRFGGTGLGLTISSSLCELMGHRLEVASEPGRGSTFTILLGGGAGSSPAPRRAPAATRSARARSSRDSGRRAGSARA